MAIAKALLDTDTASGVALPDAYHRVFTFNGMPDGSIEFNVAIYASPAARTANKDYVTIKRYRISDFDHTDAKAAKKKMYEYLKTLEEYSGATDV